MVIEPILKGLLLGLILSISIGPVIFAIIKQSLTNGKSSGYAFVAGVSSSDIILLLICNFFTSLFNLVLNHKSSIALAGAGFLLLMGLYTLFFKKIMNRTKKVRNTPKWPQMKQNKRPNKKVWI